MSRRTPSEMRQCGRSSSPVRVADSASAAMRMRRGPRRKRRLRSRNAGGDVAQPGYGTFARIRCEFRVSLRAVETGDRGNQRARRWRRSRACVFRGPAVRGRRNQDDDGARQAQFPAEYGLSWLLPRMIGLTRANELLLTSRAFTQRRRWRSGLINARVSRRHAASRNYALTREPDRDGVAEFSASNALAGVPRSAARRRASVHDSERLLERDDARAGLRAKESLRSWRSEHPAVATTRDDSVSGHPPA